MTLNRLKNSVPAAKIVFVASGVVVQCTQPFLNALPIVNSNSWHVKALLRLGPNFFSKIYLAVAMKPEPANSIVAFATDLGWMAFEHDGRKIFRLTFGHEYKAQALKALGHKSATSGKPTGKVANWIELLTRYAQGEQVRLDRIPVADQTASEFEIAVRKACRSIGYGEVLTYGELAAIVQRPAAARAVGNVMRKNPTPLLVPCHRVVGSNNLGGFSAPQGLQMKEHLLVMELGDAGCECCECTALAAV
jgi:methylated-DNA-[protein]-cysteine S-methyltransferase